MRARPSPDVEQRDDEALLRMLINEHGRAMQAYATRLLNDVSAAQDVVQEALVRAWRHQENVFNRKGSVRGWLLTIVHNLAVDAMRARAIRPAVVSEPERGEPLQLDHAGGVVDSIAVRHALAGLSREHREAIEYTYLRGLTVEETSRALGVPSGTVKSRVFYAMRALRGSFASAAA